MMPKPINPIAISFQVGVPNTYWPPYSLLVKELPKESVSFPPLASFHQVYKHLSRGLKRLSYPTVFRYAIDPILRSLKLPRHGSGARHTQFASHQLCHVE